MDLRYKHGIVVSNGVFEFFKENLKDELFLYTENSKDYGSDIVYNVINTVSAGDNKITITVENDLLNDIYTIPDLSIFTGVLNGYGEAIIDSISKIDDLSFSVNLSNVNAALMPIEGYDIITTFGLRLLNSAFYEHDFFNFPNGYDGARISNKTFGITARLLITTKDDGTNLGIEYITQKIHDLIFYDNMGKLPISIDDRTIYLIPFGTFNQLDITQENKEISVRLVTISFSYKLRYK